MGHDLKTVEGRRAYHKEWRAKNKAKVSRANREFYERNAEEMRARTAQWREQNPEKHKQQEVARMERYHNDPEFRERVLQWGKESRARRKDYIAEYERRRVRENRGKYRGIRATNKAQRALRTPVWADTEAINFFYECCPAGCEVDHIIPLRGRKISGLHVESNLQWLTAEQNREKLNKWPYRVR